MTTSADVPQIMADVESLFAGSDDDGYAHWVCHNPDIALCGADVSGSEWADDDDPTPNCPICDRLVKDGVPCSPGCNIHER